jgi:cutinase
VRGRHFAELAGAVVVAFCALPSASLPSVSAQPCPDVDVVFARGTTEAPGFGETGQAFIDALRAKLAGKWVDAYAVDYPATTNFPTAVVGINDASIHIRSIAANCPKTKMVLGGYSQGAAVIGFVTASVVPDGVALADVPNPMSPDIADHVAVVALFGKPSPRFMRAINQPPVTVGPLYSAKTIDLCVPDDLICSSGRNWSAHVLYTEDGLTEQAATFAADRLMATFAVPTPTGPEPGPAPMVATGPAPGPAAVASGPAPVPAPVVTPVPAPVAATGPAPGPTPMLASGPAPGPTSTAITS